MKGFTLFPALLCLSKSRGPDPCRRFSAWIHICAIRLFVESILRYGLPPQFLAVLLKPNAKNAAKLRKLLGSLFGNTGGWRTTHRSLASIRFFRAKRVSLPWPDICCF